VATGKLLRSLEDLDTLVWSVACSPDGRALATGDFNGALHLWELASGRRRHSFTGHESPIDSLAFSPDGRTLAAASADAPVYVWDVTSPTEAVRLPLSDDELRRCWIALGSADAAVAFQAINRLAAAPEQALPLLRQRLAPAASVDPRVIRPLIDVLDSDQFARRQKGAAELEKLGDGILPQLRTALQGQPELEVRQRLQRLIERLEAPTGERLRQVRAVEVLERLGTAEARTWLEELAGGAPGARLTREAGAACARHQRR
jgi:hypothetical protein